MGKAKRNRAARAAAIVKHVKPAPRPSMARRTRAFITGMLPVVALVLGTRQLVAEAYRIPSGSMEPTLLPGDQLFVNKMRFGPHIPFTNRLLPGYATPRRGDVTVFVSPPQDERIRMSPEDITPILVKRIVGMPGDTVLMRHGQLLVNGGVMASPNTNALPDSIADVPQDIFDWQHAIEVQSTRFGAPVKAPSLHEWGPLVVPRDSYFMMGDNRDNSVDSRYYGTVPRENFRGTPTFVYYSYDPDRGVDFLRAVTAIRWSRLGTWIH